MTPKRMITLPSGRRITIGEYVRSCRILKTMDLDDEVAKWEWYPCKVSHILHDIRWGIHDRINQGIPYVNR